MEDLLSAFRKCKELMWDGSWVKAEKGFRKVLPLAKEVLGSDSFAVAAIHFEIAECTFSLSEAKKQREDAEELTEKAWARIQEGLTLLRARQASSGGMMFSDPRVMRGDEVSFRQQDSAHSVAKRQPHVASDPTAMAQLSTGAGYWAYSLLVKVAYFASHRFIPWQSALRFAPLKATPALAEECRQLVLEGAALMMTSGACPVVLAEDLKFFDNFALIATERPEYTVAEFFGGDGFKLGEIQQAFTEILPVAMQRGIFQNSSFSKKVQQSKQRRAGGAPQGSANGQRQQPELRLQQQEQANQPTSLEEQERFYAERQKAERARQLAKGGLKPCSLASCGALERSVNEHKLCSRCKAVRYCCADHQRLDWKAHKPSCVPRDGGAKGGGAEK